MTHDYKMGPTKESHLNSSLPNEMISPMTISHESFALGPTQEKIAASTYAMSACVGPAFTKRKKKKEKRWRQLATRVKAS